MTPSDFRWHVANRQPPGTSDTSRLATDHINNPSAINTIFNLAYRPTADETMRDGSTRPVPHVLKDGADSIGIAGASLRVYLNIGMCGDYQMTLHDPIDGVRTPQQPFDMDHARAECEDWRNTEARMPAAEAFLKTTAPLQLADAPGGHAYLTASEDVLRQGKLAFADSCAGCHSSKQPPAGTADRKQWYRESVLADDFLTNNFLSDDKRYPVTIIGTNIGRALASNATRGHIWDQFSSDTYKALPSGGTVRVCTTRAIRRARLNSRCRQAAADTTARRRSRASGRRRRTCTTTRSASSSRIRPWRAGWLAFADGMEKMLWPEKRLGLQSIPVTTTDSTVDIPGTTRHLRVPLGTPIDYRRARRSDRAGAARRRRCRPSISPSGSRPTMSCCRR